MCWLDGCVEFVSVDLVGPELRLNKNMAGFPFAHFVVGQWVVFMCVVFWVFV